jgi:hypothetical protein
MLIIMISGGILDLAAILEQFQVAPYPKIFSMGSSTTMPRFMLLLQKAQFLHESALLCEIPKRTLQCMAMYCIFVAESIDHAHNLAFCWCIVDIRMHISRKSFLLSIAKTLIICFFFIDIQKYTFLLQLWGGGTWGAISLVSDFVWGLITLPWFLGIHSHFSDLSCVLYVYSTISLNYHNWNNYIITKHLVHIEKWCQLCWHVNIFVKANKVHFSRTQDE